MESALTPREIQARIRGGESLADVAAAAGVPVEKIDAYAGPVIAEREHAAMMARTSQVRRRGESSAQRHLGDVVADALARRGIDAAQLLWDAWRGEDRRWTVQVSWTQQDQERRARFDFDQRGRYSLAGDESARALIDERPPVVSRSTDPDAEPTIDLNDELAIVRVVQDDAPPPAVLPDVPAARIMKLPGAVATTGTETEPDDYLPAELEQVDGVYDIIPNLRSDMDVLYDMLAGFNEDSVRIYAGLAQPVSATPKPATPPPESSSPQQEPGNTPEPEQPEQSAIPAPSQPESSQELRSSADAQVVKQEPLVVEPAPPAPARPTKRRKRASVPTWDEIMFGGPTPSK